MNINWLIGRRDVNRVKELIAKQTAAGNPTIREREEKNLSKNKRAVTPTVFWHRMVSARITTQNPAGPGSRVDKLSNAIPFPLSLRKVRSEPNAERFIAKTVRDWGIGKSNQIAKDLATNLARLENGVWKETLKECNRLTTLVSAGEEREVATYIDDAFQGFGPKQSRNLLQMLGLTRYEIPIDSRLAKWLNEFGFPVELNASVLRSRRRYELVLDEIQKLCQKANKYPCIFDAAAFASQAPHTRRRSK